VEYVHADWLCTVPSYCHPRRCDIPRKRLPSQHCPRASFGALLTFWSLIQPLYQSSVTWAAPKLNRRGEAPHPNIPLRASFDTVFPLLTDTASVSVISDVGCIKGQQACRSPTPHTPHPSRARAATTAEIRTPHERCPVTMG